jgi:hypothetical protein
MYYKIWFKNYLSLTLLLVLTTVSNAQDDDLSKLVDESAGLLVKDKTIATFKTTRLINLTTNEQVKKGELDFRIAHRFGDLGATPKELATNFLGFDQVTDIRFSFDYGISNKLAVGIGRSKGAYAQSQVFDLNAKIKIIEQVNKGFPFGVSAYGGLTYTTMASTGNSSSITYFNNTEAHRINYFAQLLLFKKVNTNFSFIIAPTVVHRNLVNIGDNNTTYALAAGARMKIGKRTAIIADYYQVMNVSSLQKLNDLQMPIGLGMEIETGGHVFHVLLSTNKGLVESQFLPNNTDKFTKGEIRLGFNVSRIFTLIHDKN